MDLFRGPVGVRFLLPHGQNVRTFERAIIMDLCSPSLLIYLLAGVGVAGAVYLSQSASHSWQCGFRVALAVLFWPLYLPLLLARSGDADDQTERSRPCVPDELAAAIAQVDAELEAALGSLDGWAEGVLAREKDRIRELRAAWTTQAERIRDMDRLLALPEYAVPDPEEPAADGNERLRNSQRARWQNIQRLRQVRQRAHNDLLGSLAWVRELVSMMHLAKFTGAPAARAEELVAQIAAVVEGLSELTWQANIDGKEPATELELTRGANSGRTPDSLPLTREMGHWPSFQ